VHRTGLWPRPKPKFSEIIERARSEGPQTITRKGRTAAIVVGVEDRNGRPSVPATWRSSSLDLRCADRNRRSAGSKRRRRRSVCEFSSG
jgi:prevent-host-death family protein